MARFIGLRGGGQHAFQQAEQAFSRAVVLLPGSPLARYERGLLYWRELNQPARAIADFSQIIAQQPEALFMRGMAYQALGDYRQAVQDLEAYLVAQPGSRSAANVRSQLAALYSLLEDFPPALESGSNSSGGSLSASS
ncbi:MAG: tetratricopeptide repeat protein [Anaerolineae bacterium]|nr:tetratricopeptide repeat protein [Anaerolineae bacterium]